MGSFEVSGNVCEAVFGARSRAHFAVDVRLAQTFGYECDAEIVERILQSEPGRTSAHQHTVNAQVLISTAHALNPPQESSTRYVPQRHFCPTVYSRPHPGGRTPTFSAQRYRLDLLRPSRQVRPSRP